MYKDIAVAVVGAGFIGPVHIEGLIRLGIHVTGVFDTDLGKAEQVRQAFGLAKIYRSFDEILADETVQSVHITVPNVLHFDMAKRVLAAGKHVMCEKPLAMNAAETAELVSFAKDSGLVAGVNYNIRFYPLNLEARDIIQRGDLGTVFSVVGSYVQDWLLYDTDYNWRVLAEQGGALRAIADIGTHWMDLVCSITGLEPEAVCADLKTVHPIRKRPKGEIETFTGKTATQQEHEEVTISTEDCGAVMFRFKGGARGVLWVSQTTAGRKNCLRYEIAGSKQALAWNSESPNDLWIGHRASPNETLMRDPSLVADMPRSYINFPGGHNEGFPDTFKQCFRAFYNAVVSDDPAGTYLYPTFEEGHREVVLCEAIQQSHLEERWIRL